MLGGRRKLFEPIKIADVHIKNRIAVLALGLGYASTQQYLHLGLL
jgi:2,4-dienoyl-CoA reductase-like NADH-dependent reductase (Old Yellow Enzyme family)